MDNNYKHAADSVPLDGTDGSADQEARIYRETDPLHVATTDNTSLDDKEDMISFYKEELSNLKDAVQEQHKHLMAVRVMLRCNGSQHAQEVCLKYLNAILPPIPEYGVPLSPAAK